MRQMCVHHCSPPCFIIVSQKGSTPFQKMRTPLIVFPENVDPLIFMDFFSENDRFSIGIPNEHIFKNIRDKKIKKSQKIIIYQKKIRKNEKPSHAMPAPLETLFTQFRKAPGPDNCSSSRENDNGFAKDHIHVQCYAIQQGYKSCISSIWATPIENVVFFTINPCTTRVMHEENKTKSIVNHIAKNGRQLGMVF